MNQNQRTVIFIALFLLLCCGIFVPYDGTETHIRTTYALMSWGNESPRPAVVTTEKANSFIGYFPIFNPPSKRDIVKSFYKENDLARDYESRSTFPVFNSKEEYVENKIDNILNSKTYESNINLSRLIIQIFILLIITIGIVLLSAGENKKSWWDRLKT